MCIHRGGLSAMTTGSNPTATTRAAALTPMQQVEARDLQNEYDVNTREAERTIEEIGILRDELNELESNIIQLEARIEDGRAKPVSNAKRQLAAYKQQRTNTQKGIQNAQSKLRVLTGLASKAEDGLRRLGVEPE